MAISLAISHQAQDAWPSCEQDVETVTGSSSAAEAVQLLVSASFAPCAKASVQHKKHRGLKHPRVLPVQGVHFG